MPTKSSPESSRSISKALLYVARYLQPLCMQLAVTHPGCRHWRADHPTLEQHSRRQRSSKGPASGLKTAHGKGRSAVHPSCGLLKSCYKPESRHVGYETTQSHALIISVLAVSQTFVSKEFAHRCSDKCIKDAAPAGACESSLWALYTWTAAR